MGKQGSVTTETDVLRARQNGYYGDVLQHESAIVSCHAIYVFFPLSLFPLPAPDLFRLLVPSPIPSPFLSKPQSLTS